MRLRSPTFLLVIASLAACAARRPAATEAPPPPLASRGGGLHVSLVWNSPVDLDLYLTDPSWETLYFGNNPTRSGSRLEADHGCATLAGTSIERAGAANPAVGAYRVGVDFIDPCATDQKTVAYRIVVDLDGARVERTGTARLEVFQVKALEFGVAQREDGALELIVPDAKSGVAPLR